MPDITPKDIFGRSLGADTPLFEKLVRLDSNGVQVEFEAFELKTTKDADSVLEGDDEWSTVDHSAEAKVEHAYLRQYAGFEFLGHHLAYQDLTDHSTVSVLETDGTHSEYIVHRLRNINDVEGLKGHVLVPKNPEASGHNIKVMFRGTASKSGVGRDIFEVGGAGAYSFEGERENFIEQINGIVKDFNREHNKKGNPVSLTVAGHSLGAADAQNCTAALMDAIAQNKGLTSTSPVPVHKRHALNGISKLIMSTKNAAGVALKTAQRAKAVAGYLAECRAKGRTDLTIESYNLQVGGDAVQQTGEAHILSDAPVKHAKVDVMKAHVLYCEPTRAYVNAAVAVTAFSYVPSAAALGMNKGAAIGGVVGGVAGAVVGGTGGAMIGGASALALGALPFAKGELSTHCAKFFDQPIQANYQRFSNKTPVGHQEVAAKLGKKSSGVNILQTGLMGAVGTVGSCFNYLYNRGATPRQMGGPLLPKATPETPKAIPVIKRWFC
jgi:uncharacterized protein YdbL (DUF1318 family)